MLVYSIKNTVTGFFNRPIYVNSQQEALNLIQNILITDKDKALFGLKDKLELYFIGRWDDVNGIFFPHVEPKDDVIVESNMFVCSLKDIFDSIPEEFLQPELTRDDIKACVEKIQYLSSELLELKNRYDCHIHPMKRGFPYNEKK